MPVKEESLDPEGLQDAGASFTRGSEDTSSVSGEVVSPWQDFHAKAAEDDVSNMNLFSTSGDDDLKLLSGASGSFASIPGVGMQQSADATGRSANETGWLNLKKNKKTFSRYFAKTALEKRKKACFEKFFSKNKPTYC